MPGSAAPSTAADAHPEQLYRAYVFDMDGTIYLGDDLLPGSERLINTLRDRDIVVRFLSNNPTKDPEQYAEKLARLGLPTPVSDIANTVVTMTNWLVDHHPDAVVYPIAEQPLIRSLEKAGIAMSDDPAQIDIVIASYDRTFTYEKLQTAFDAIWFHQRAFLVATNPDRYCPFPGGRGEPDCAAIIAAIEACTGTTCRVNVGKPDPTMLAESLRGLDIEPAEAVMVGDRLSTDIGMALRAGADSALVLTGDTQREELEGLAPEASPTYVLDRVDRLLPTAVWEQLGWAAGDP